MVVGDRSMRRVKMMDEEKKEGNFEIGDELRGQCVQR